MANVLFVCLQNAGRSQISEALFEQKSAGLHHAKSAGSRPANAVHSHVVVGMREIGIDLSEKKPRKVTPDLAQWADVVVTMGCGDECPFIPGKQYLDWQLADPSKGGLDDVRALIKDVAARVDQLLEQLDTFAIKPLARDQP